MTNYRRRIWHQLTLFATISLISVQAAATQPASIAPKLSQLPGVVAVEYVFKVAPFEQCHASTIVQSDYGLVAAWFGGTEEKHPDVGIWLSRQSKGGWHAPVEVANGIQSPNLRYPTWNPVMFQADEGPLLLFYKVGPTPDSWWGMMMTSTDGGSTWSRAARLPEGVIGPVKNKPIQLSDDTLVCPSSTEHEGWRLHLERTPNLGKTWSISQPLNDGRLTGAIQPSILLHADGRWQILARDERGEGCIWTAWSTDAGKTWSDLESAGLPNPSSGIDAVTLADGRQILVYNHTHDKQIDSSNQSRSILNVAVSDDGEQWQAALVLENSSGEYSYPAVIQASDGLVHITYTWRRKRIKHVVLDPNKLKLTPIINGAWPEVPVRNR
jgi:predicted neuraminidase